MPTLDDVRNSPNILSVDYQHAAVAQRIQLTGHIHQALPDVCEQAYAEHWDALNKQGEERWDLVFDKSERVRRGFAQMVDGQSEYLALASSVHDLFVRFLSALPFVEGGRIVTTDAEHPSIGRQLARFHEAGRVEVVQVSATPVDNLVERLAANINDKTLAVCVSSVNFENGQQTLELDTLLPVCQKFGAELFVDAYQSVNVLPFSLQDYNLEQAFVVGGGAKYCQMGNGICFMNVPPGRDYRPQVTGWFGNFDPVLDDPAAMPVAYSDGASRFNGSSNDALPLFRASHVLDYFATRDLNVDFLADVNHHQLSFMAKKFLSLGLDPALIKLPVDVEYMGGFMGFKSPHAQVISEHMRDRGVHTDYCKDWLRLGPAPYLCDEQLEDGILALQESVEELARG